MKRRIPQRILSAILALVLTISCVPVGYAAEAETEPAVVMETEAPAAEAAETVPVEETEAAEEAPVQTEPVQETEITPEETEPAETLPAEETEAGEESPGEGTVPQETLPAETTPAETVPEETVPGETVPEETAPEETVPEETVPEETVPAELPCGFAGLPADYVLSEEDAAAKQDMIDNKVLELLAGMTAGEGYAADYVITTAADEEEAALFAAAYSGEVISYVHGITRIRLLTASVAQAVEACLDPAYNLPAVSPDFISQVTPILAPEQMTVTRDVPQLQTWATWVRENMSNPDPALLDPDGINYQWMHDAVGTYAAWGITTGADWVKVAVIDTGVNTSHTDLNGRVTSIDIGLGTSDVGDHGTHVAGIIGAAMDNGNGGTGIAPGVSVLNIRAASANGGFYDSDIITAIYTAVAEGAHVINMSLGGTGYNRYMQSAISYAVACGVTVVASMGNDGSNNWQYPAAYNGVIAVAATDSAGNRARFSNYGEWADVAAPGDSIYSTVRSGGYARYNGTSMAAPVVSGVVALYISAMGGPVDPAEVEKVLEASATKTKESGMGAGIVNIANMLDGVPDVPYYQIHDGYYIYSAKDVIPCDAGVYFSESAITGFYGTDGDVGGAMLLTLDGSTPSMKNGQIINGFLVDDTGRLSLEKYAGSTVTIKAARISGMGIVGKTLTLKLKVGGDDNVDSVVINGAAYMMPGKSSTYTATVEPAATADQSVYWEVIGWSGSMYSAKIDSKTGKLTVPKGKGVVRICATSLADPSKYAYLDVSVQEMPAVSKIYLNFTNAYLYVGEAGTIKVVDMVEANGFSLNQEYYEVEWSSSNPKIASVDQNGYVTGLAKGNVTITCKALDGSGKSAKCKLEVRQMVTDIQLTGQSTIAPGSTATYKAVVLPKNATYNKVTWFLDGAPYGVTIDSKTGKVTVPSYVRQEQTFSVVAMAQDEYQFYSVMDVTVRAKCTAVYIGTDGYDGMAAGVQFSKQWVKTVNLFSLDLDDSSGIDNQVDLDAWFSGPADSVRIEWSSSAPHIASVDRNGVVTAHQAGTAKITLTALDGSNKKATCDVKVTNPASSISISSSAPRMSTSRYYLAYGKSAKNTAVFATTYGKPANQKVQWSYSLYIVDAEGNYSNVTSAFAGTNWVSVNSSGNLTVKKNLQDYWNYYLDYDEEFVVRVYAEALDGTGVWDSLEYTLIRPTTKVMTASKAYVTSNSSGGSILFYSDQWYGFDAAFTATSSNPKVASVDKGSYSNAITYVGYDSSRGMNAYRINMSFPGYVGSANITIKAADGSNKSCTFKITVN